MKLVEEAPLAAATAFAALGDRTGTAFDFLENHATHLAAEARIHVSVMQDSEDFFRRE